MAVGQMQWSLTLVLWQSISNSPGLTAGPCAWPRPTRSNFSRTFISFGLIHDAISSLSCQLLTWKSVKDSGLIHKHRGKNTHTKNPTHIHLQQIDSHPTLLHPSPTQRAEWPLAASGHESTRSQGHKKHTVPCSQKAISEKLQCALCNSSCPCGFLHYISRSFHMEWVSTGNRPIT